MVQADGLGLHNMVCEGTCPRYDVAVEFVRLLGLEKEINIKIVSSGFFANEYFAPRPNSEKLLNLKLSANGINYMKDWKECLADYVETFKPHFEKGG
jgi:dTDP-4-dehydrorhamnose reductase